MESNSLARAYYAHSLSRRAETNKIKSTPNTCTECCKHALLMARYTSIIFIFFTLILALYLCAAGIYGILRVYTFCTVIQQNIVYDVKYSYHTIIGYSLPRLSNSRRSYQPSSLTLDTAVYIYEQRIEA